MSNAMPDQDELTERIAAAMRDVIASAVLTNERIARGFGLNVVDLQTFGIVAASPVPLTAGELSARTELPTSTTTRVIDRLEKAGFVRRSPDPTDRRKVVVHPNLAKLADMTDPYAAVMDGMRRLHEGFDTGELTVVARYLETMARSGVGSAEE